MMNFFALFPEVAYRETRRITILRPALRQGDVPPGEYAFFEHYCVEDDCDCRMVLLLIARPGEKRQVGAISHYFELRPRETDIEQSSLDLAQYQSEFAPGLLKHFTETMLTPEYSERLELHYRMVKDALKDWSHRIHEVILAAESETTPSREPRRRKRRR